MVGLYINNEDGTIQDVYDVDDIISLAGTYSKQLGFSRNKDLNVEEIEALFKVYGVGKGKIINILPDGFVSDLNSVVKNLAEFELDYLGYKNFKYLPAHEKLDVKKNIKPNIKDIEKIDFGNGSGMYVYNPEKVAELSSKYLSQLGFDPEKEIDITEMKRLLKLYALGRYKTKVGFSGNFNTSIKDFSEMLAKYEMKYYDYMNTDTEDLVMKKYLSDYANDLV